MSAKRKVQILADLSMTVMLPILMAYSLIGETAHEWIGIAMFILFILHHALNYRWFTSAFHGKYPPVRIFSTVIDVLLLFDMLSLMISGVMMSRYVFAFLNINRGMGFARTLHLLGSYWGFFLMSLHLGTHFGMFIGVIKKALHVSGKAVHRTAFLRSITAVVSAYGAYEFISRGIIDHMLLKNQFVYLDYSKPLSLFLIDYVSIMVLFAAAGYYANKIITKKRRGQDDNAKGASQTVDLKNKK